MIGPAMIGPAMIDSARMKAITNTAPNVLAWQEWPIPQPGPGQVRIRVGACGICATDITMIAGWERTTFPCIPGHEWSGTVEALGAGVDPALAGRRCVAENVLSDGGEVGFEHPGGYAPYLLTEARNVYPLPDDYPLARAALIEPLAVMVRALRRLRLEDRRSALVLGDGPIGLLAVMLLKASAVAEIVLVGGRDPRLELGCQLGATAAVNYHASTNLAKAIHAASPAPFANVIEASGSPAALAVSLEVAGQGGKIAVIGDYGAAQAGFAWNRILHRELELIGSNASAGAWPEAVRLAVQGGLPLDRLITNRLPVHEFQTGYALTRRRGPEVIKVVLEWEPA
jgi:threonine dehydrogenase-like Zn-dependent dehydrogenase